MFEYKKEGCAIKIQTYESFIHFYHAIFIRCGIAALCFGAIAVLLFFVLHIKKVFHQLICRKLKGMLRRAPKNCRLTEKDRLVKRSERQKSIDKTEKLTINILVAAVTGILLLPNQQGDFAYGAEAEDGVEYSIQFEDRSGQKIESETVVYDDLKNRHVLYFHIQTDKAAEPSFWHVSDTAQILEFDSVNVKQADNCQNILTGEISFGTKEAGTTELVLYYRDDADITAGSPVLYEKHLKLSVAQKPLVIEQMSFSGGNIKQYDGTPDVFLASAAVSGIVNGDDVKVNTSPAKAYKLADKNVCADGVCLNIDENYGGILPELIGLSASNYRLSADNIQSFLCKIVPATISVKVAAERPYYEANPDMDSLVRKNAGQIFSGFATSDNQAELLEAIIETYMPAFDIQADKKSGTGAYPIFAKTPDSEKPDKLKNYQFDFSSGEPAGMLYIRPRQVHETDYLLSGEGIVMKDGRVWIKKGCQNDAPIQPCKESGYDSVYYYSSEDAGTELDAPPFYSGEKDGAFWFRLAKKDEEGYGITAYSEFKRVNYFVDGGVSAVIQLKANQTVQYFHGLPEEKIELGVFGNTQNVLAEVSGEDSESGLLSIQYIIKDYKAVQNKSEAELLELLDREDGWQGGADNSVKAVAFTPGIQVVFAKAADLAGNIQYAATDGILIDSRPPEFLSAGIKDKKANGVYNRDVTVMLEAADRPDGDIQASGLKTISYTAYLNGILVQEAGWSKTIYMDSESQESPYKGAFTIPAGSILSTAADAKNHVILILEAEDYAGNGSRSCIEFDFDIAKPVMNVSMDGTAKNQIYFNENRTVTLQVIDAYFDKESGAVFEGIEAAVLASGYEDGWKYLGHSKYEIKYCYQNEGAHVFNMTVTDMGGNCSEMGDVGCTPKQADLPCHYRQFIIDKTKPEILSAEFFTYDGLNVQKFLPGKSEAKRCFSQTEVFALITVKDQCFVKEGADKGGLALDTSAENACGELVNAETAYSWTEGAQKDIQILRVNFISDAVYRFSLGYSDLAGNVLKENFESVYFTVDTKPPSAKLTIIGTEYIWPDIQKHIVFNIFSNKREEFLIFDEADETSGIQSAAYFVSCDEMTISELDNAYRGGLWTKGRRITLSPNRRCIVYGRIEDRAGNYSYISSGGIILDDTIDSPQIEIMSPVPANGIYQKDVIVHIKACDADSAGRDDFSGIRSVYYEVRSAGAKTQSGYLDIGTKVQRNIAAEADLCIDAAKNNNNAVSIYVKSEDYAGNFSEKSIAIKIDCTEPEIEVRFNDTKPESGRYFKNARTAVIYIREKNFNPDYVNIHISNTGSAKPSISAWTKADGFGSGEAAVYKALIKFEEDGDYSFTVDCMDMAMNKANKPYVSDRFTIDKTKPHVQVTYAPGSVLNGRFCSSERTAAITVTERNFNAKDVRVQVKAFLDNKPLPAAVPGKWIDFGEAHTAYMTFSDDGDYFIEVNYKDLAGNSADSIKDRFTIDTKGPDIQISGVENNCASKTAVLPVIAIADMNPDIAQTHLTLTGALSGENPVDNLISRTFENKEQIIRFKGTGIQSDDVYTLTVSAADRAGNESSEKIQFSVNQNGSVYMLGDTAKTLVKKRFVSQPQTVVIQEVNVDTITFSELAVSKNGKAVKLDAGRDYQIKEIGGNGSWKKYTYVISADCFNEEGMYAIQLYSEDRAGNKMTSRTKGVDIEFVVDKTEPFLSVSNLENRACYREAVHTFVLNARDNTALSCVKLFIDGQLVHTYEKKEIASTDGVIQIDVEAKNSFQTIEINAFDEAGNKSEPLKYNILVNASLWVQFLMNRPLFFGTITAGAILISAGIFLILLSRSRRFKRTER